MPILLKKMVAGALIAGSVTFAVLIISSNSPSPSVSATSLADLGQIDPLQPETIPDASTVAAKNLTESASQMITAGNLQTPETLAADYLAEASKDFDYNTLKPTIAADRLKIVPTNDPRLIAIYLKGLDDALNSSLKNATLNETDMTGNLRFLTNAYTKTIENLYQMAAPQIFARLHENLIANLGGQKAATEMILQNLESDPIRSLLGLQAITNFSEELTTIQKAITDLADKS